MLNHFKEVIIMTYKSNQTMEQRLRRALNKHGYSLHKSRKGISADNLGGYMIVNYYMNACVGGSRYDMNLDDVSDFLRMVCEG